MILKSSRTFVSKLARILAPPVAPVQNEKENVSEWIQVAGSCKSCAVMIGNNIIHDEYEYHQCNVNM